MKKIVFSTLRIIGAATLGASMLILSSEGLRNIVGIQASAIPTASAQQPSINGNCNVIGNNNFNCNTFYVRPTRLALTAELREQLLSHMPDRNKTVHINAVGASKADQGVVGDIITFLKSSGFNVSFDSLTGMRIPAPDNKLSFSEGANGYYLEIAPSAN